MEERSVQITTHAPIATSGQSRSRSSTFLLNRYGWGVFTLAPLAVLIWVVARFSVDVPYLDQWQFVPLMDKMFRGELSFGDLWAQFNEHRIFFPKLIMLGLARFTGWNIRWECAFTVLLGIGVWLILVLQIRRTARALGMPQLHWAIPVCSLVVFSISQFENWLWGWSLQLMLGLLAALSAILLLAMPPLRWPKFLGSLALGFVATFSFANGVLVWPIGFLLIVWTRTTSRRALIGNEPKIPEGNPQRQISVFAVIQPGLWVFAAVLSLWLYLRDYHSTKGHPPLTSILQAPLLYAAYLLKYLGSTCAQYGEGGVLPDRVWACVLGLLSLILLARAGWKTARRYQANRAALVPWFALCAYSVGTALITAAARAGFGSNQALASRYCSLTGPLWLSIVVLLIILASEDGTPSSQSRRITSEPRLARWLLLAVIGLLACSSGFAVRSASELSDHLIRWRQLVLALRSDPSPNGAHDELFGLVEHPKEVIQEYPVLEKHRLSLFRNINE